MPAPLALRGVTEAELAILRLPHIHVHKQLWIQDAAGVFRDWTDADGLNFLKSARWGESIDQQVASATFTLHREIRDAAGVVQSLAPLMSGSALNQIDGEYAPAIHSNRGIRYRTATTPAGVAPVTADWVTRFEGVTDLPEWGGDALTITARDLGARLQETMVEDLHSYGDAAGVEAELVMQSIITDAGLATLLDVPVSPGFMVTAYDVNGVSVLDALTTLSLQFGWDVRYQFTGRDSCALVLSEPRRDLVTPDATLDGNDYRTVPSFALDSSGVRNAVRVVYHDTELGVDNEVPVEHAGSIAVFGRRFMRLAFGEESAIDTEAEATMLGNAAIADLAEPDATQQVEGRDWWPVTLGALLEWAPNGVHYDETQLLAVTAFEHVHDRSGETTRITVRGKPAGAYKRWLTAGGTPLDQERGAGLPAPVIGPLLGETSALGNTVKEGRVWLYVKFDRNTQEVRIHAEISPSTPCPAPAIMNATHALTLRRQDGAIASATEWETWVPLATNPGWYKKVTAFGVGFTGEQGLHTTLEARAFDTHAPTLADVTGLSVTRAADVNKLVYTVPAGMTSGHPIYAFHERNGAVIDWTPATEGAHEFDDIGVTLQNAYDYKVYLWSLGISGSTDGVAPPVEVPPPGPPAPPGGEVPAPVTGNRPYFLGDTPTIIGGKRLWDGTLAPPYFIDVDFQCDDTTPGLLMELQAWHPDVADIPAHWQVIAGPWAVEPGEVEHETLRTGWTRFRLVTYEGPGGPAPTYKEVSDTMDARE